ncbi:MAG: ABC transporter ATP-binding protein [Elusimicrobiota bacterium]
MADNKNILTFENVCIGYNKNAILHNLSFTVQENDFLGIIGPNGSGKTTLINALVGISGVLEGRILFRDKDISLMDEKLIAQNIAIVSRGIDPAFDFTVFEFVSFGRFPYKARLSSLNKKDISIIDSAIKCMDLISLERRSIRALSSGEFQRVLIAQALAETPRILILDEPIAHLDLKYQLQIMNFLRELHSKGITVITVLHDINMTAGYCEKALVLKDGRIEAYGNSNDVFNEDMINLVYGVNGKMHVDEKTGKKYIFV